MKRSADRILVTHVGSLVRPPAIREVMAAREQDLPYDEAAFRKTLRQEVANVVREQAQAGVDIVSDGEYGKAGWIRYVAERLGGFVHREVKPGEREFNPVYLIREAEKFPEFYAAYNAVQYYDWMPPAPGKPPLAQAGPTPVGGRKMLWDCVGPISYRGQAAIKQDIENFKAALKDTKVEEAFLPVAAPMSARGLWINSHYPNEDAVATALADALKDEYRAIVDAGFLIQLGEISQKDVISIARAGSIFSTMRSRGSPRTACVITSVGAVGTRRIPPTFRSRPSSISSSRFGRRLTRWRLPIPDMSTSGRSGKT